MKKTARHTKAHGPLASVGIGLMVSVILYLLFATAATAVLGGLDNPLGGFGIASMLSFFPPALLSGFLISKMKGEGGVLTACASAFIFILVMFLCCAVITHGKIPLSSIISYIAYVILAVMGGIFGQKRRGRRFRA